MLDYCYSLDLLAFERIKLKSGRDQCQVLHERAGSENQGREKQMSASILKFAK